MMGDNRKVIMTLSGLNISMNNTSGSGVITNRLYRHADDQMVSA